MNKNQPTRPHYIADKSQTRKYGYTVRDVNNLTTWFIGPNCTGGWYKKKRDAQQRADVLNKFVTESRSFLCVEKHAKNNLHPDRTTGFGENSLG